MFLHSVHSVPFGKNSDPIIILLKLLVKAVLSKYDMPRVLLKSLQELKTSKI